MGRTLLSMIFSALALAAAASSAHATLERAEAAWADGRYAKAAQELIGPARDGEAEAQYLLGLLYSGGRGVVEDDVDAARWFRDAARQGHPEAQNMLGRLYLEGAGVKQNVFEAAKFFYLSKEAGNQDAADVYGQIESQLPPQLVQKVEANAAAWQKKHGL